MAEKKPTARQASFNIPAYDDCVFNLLYQLVNIVDLTFLPLILDFERPIDVNVFIWIEIVRIGLLQLFMWIS